MEFKVVTVDAHKASAKKNENGFVPLIVKTLPTYSDGLDWEKDHGRSWTRSRNAAMKAAILANDECVKLLGDKKVGSYTKTCSCGCSGILPVDEFGLEVFVEFEQIG